MARSIITLTTDFGSGSTYVAQMKGVLLDLNPELTILDLTHDIAPQNIRQGALAVRDGTHYFPPGSIHVAVVDPGVGTQRQLVLAEIAGRIYLAPDNGLLTLAARDWPTTQLIALTNRSFWRSHVTATFHGRDILAPVAAHLSLGVSPTLLGEPLKTLVMLDWPEPAIDASAITGQVVSVDHFGNLISNILDQHLASVMGRHRGRLEISLGGHTIVGLSRTYGESPPGALVALFGSEGRLEIAEVGGSAARTLAVQPGDAVVVGWPGES